MGNSHITGASLCKENPVNSESEENNKNILGEYSQKDTNCQINNKKIKSQQNKKNTKVHIQQNGYVHDAKLIEEAQNESQKEIVDLNNKLNERNDRIGQLEVTLKNNLNIQLEEKSELERVNRDLQIQEKLKHKKTFRFGREIKFSPVGG